MRTGREPVRRGTVEPASFRGCRPLARHRHHGGSLAKAAFLSARNDAVANVAIIGAAGATVLTRSMWPDIVVGCVIAWMNIDAARDVLAAARGEKALAESAEA